MFITLDAAAGVPHGRQKSISDRACDQCKLRKVRCDMGNPCKTCTGRSAICTFNEARKKRGPVPGRVGKLRRDQGQSKTMSKESVLDFRDTALAPAPAPAPVANGQSPPTTSPLSHRFDESKGEYPSLHTYGGGEAQDRSAVHPVRTDSSNGLAMHDIEAMTGMQEDMSQHEALSAMSHDLEVPDFLLPSLPIDSPPDDSFNNLFATIREQDLPPIVESVEFWPKSISQEALLPWIDVYFKRLHPTVPVLNRTMIYQDMLLRTHHHDPQFGAMLLALCAFAMTQPVQIHEVASTPSRSVQARMLLEESIKMRMTVDFGENPSVHMILASFFIFACLFGNGLHKAAHHRLREAVDLANSLSMHLPQAYDNLDPETREQWLRTYLVLSVTERAYALQKHHTIGFRGSPAVNACFMRAFGSSGSSSRAQDQTDSVGMVGLLYLMETFDAIDESVVECWTGYCKYSDGCCETFDRRRAIQMFRAQRRARESCLVGSISFEPSASLLPLEHLLESQRADISVTQFWLLNRLWNLCMSHGLLRDSSDHAELRFDFAYHLASTLLSVCNNLSLPSMEVHGVGLIEKVYDITMGLVMAMNSSVLLALDSSLPSTDALTDKPSGDCFTVRELLQRLDKLVRNFRGGDHEYVSKFAMALGAIPDYYTPAG
ncbi:hypothetical protein Q7P37_001349 [Cladosporium fusiforme]